MFGSAVSKVGSAASKVGSAASEVASSVPLPGSAKKEEGFSEAEALKHVQALTQIASHPASSAEHSPILQYVLDEIESIKKTADGDVKVEVDRIPSKFGESVAVKVLPKNAFESRNAILVSAHVDAAFPVDDTSNVGLMLELARGVSQSSHGLKNPVIFLFKTEEDSTKEDNTKEDDTFDPNSSKCHYRIDSVEGLKAYGANNQCVKRPVVAVDLDSLGFALNSNASKVTEEDNTKEDDTFDPNSSHCHYRINSTEGLKAVANNMQCVKSLAVAVEVDLDSLGFALNSNASKGTGSKHPVVLITKIRKEGIDAFHEEKLLLDLKKTFSSGPSYPKNCITAQDLFSSGFIQSATDFKVYKEGPGASGLDFEFSNEPAIYHTKNDIHELLKPGSFQPLGENLLAFLMQSSAGQIDL